MKGGVAFFPIHIVVLLKIGEKWNAECIGYEVEMSDNFEVKEKSKIKLQEIHSFFLRNRDAYHS